MQSSNSRPQPRNAVSGLASSLRSAAASEDAARGQYNGGGAQGLHQRGRDAMVPDMDDSTEEDEDYDHYAQNQDHKPRHQPYQQRHVSNNSPTNNNTNQGTAGTGAARNLRQMLQDDSEDDIGHSDDDHDMNDRDNRHHNSQRQQQQQQQHHPISTMEHVMTEDAQLLQARHNEIIDEEDYDDDDDDDLDEDDDDDDDSDTVSLTEDDIDFNLVYAFHTFVATQEGQASVVRNDSLVLLEDTNVYWWLVRVLKTGIIGYIPAENIETPFERLARLNKYRNVGLSAPSPEWGTFDEPIQPLNHSTLAERSKNRRSVIFKSQNEYFGASDNDWDEEEEEDEMGEYYEGRDEPEEADQSGQDSAQKDNDSDSGKTALQLEAERVEQEILEEQRQRQQSRRSDYSMDSEDDFDEEDEEPVTNRYRRPLLDDDDLMMSTEPRKISLTPSIAQDDTSASRIQTPPGKAKKLRLAENEPQTDVRSTVGSNQRSENSYSSPEQQQSATPGAAVVGGLREDVEDEDPEARRRRLQEITEAKLDAILGSDQASGSTPSDSRKPGKFKSLFGVGKGSKDKEKAKEKERERQLSFSKANPTTSTHPPAGDGDSDSFRGRSNSNGSIASINAGAGAGTGAIMSPTFSENGDVAQQEIIALRVYPGNVDFGVSMYKTVVVSALTLASEVANQAVVKFRLAPDGVASSSDFYLTVRGFDGEETALQPTDKPMAIYQTLSAHLTTPLPANHRLSISSVSSMMSVNSYSSFTSNPPSTPTSPSSVRRIGSGRADQNQRAIRFFLNKKIRRAGSSSSIPSTPTTPTTPTHEDLFWVKVVCQERDLPQTMVLLDGSGTALDRNDARTHGQITAAKAEHWVSMQSTSNVGDVIFKVIEKFNIHSGVVDGVPEHVIAAKNNTLSSGIVIQYQLGLRMSSPTSRRFKNGDEVSLAPQTPLIRCFEEHQLVPIRRSPKADVASMPLTPEYIFYLRKSPKSLQAEGDFAQEQALARGAATAEISHGPSTPRKVPSPLQVQSLRSPADEPPRSPIQPSPTSISSQRSLRTPRSTEDFGVNGDNGPHSPSFHQSRPGMGPRTNSGSGSLSPAIPRRTDSAITGPPSPVTGHAARTPTPDQVNMGRNRSPSVSQGLRVGQAPSPAPSNTSGHDYEVSRSTTPERPARPDRMDRQRAISPPMTHGPSPLSMAQVLHQETERDKVAGGGAESGGSSRDSKIAPLSIKKNMTQGMDIILNKGVIRSSRLINSRQYRYSFIPVEGGEEVDISEIIEDILGEEDEMDDDDSQDGADLQYLDLGDNDETSAARRDQRSTRLNGSGAGNRPLSSVLKNASPETDRLELITSSARGGDTLLKLERVLAADIEYENRKSAASASRLEASRATRASPTSMYQQHQSGRGATASSSSLASLSSAHNSKRDSDVELQMASRPSSRGLHNPGVGPLDSAPGTPRPLRSGSPYGTAAKQSTVSGMTGHRGVNSPLKEGATTNIDENRVSASQQVPSSDARSFSPIPRRLQSPSPVGLKSSTSPKVEPSSTASGRISPASSVRSNSPAVSASSPTGVSRLRSASTGSTTGSGMGGSKEWLLSSDYNTGMQDLLTLVRAGRSSSVSTPSGISMMRGLGSAGVGSPLIGKDGKIVALPSTIKASLLSKSSHGEILRSMLPISSSHDDQNKDRGAGDDEGGDSEKGLVRSESSLKREKTRREEQQAATRMMLMMLNELTLKDVQQECHPDVYECWKDVDADLDRVERVSSLFPFSGHAGWSSG
ncbi:hypothetical protein BGW38_005161 [Lunasporangiospora selenospora]|uniref:SH3 domain-containing protein n=1 Tax=Lunasporangiospora selenospora TaxID=979761 RepID=A0A9P6FZR0_9FUNG|nr:hypothetical protein BGW38_005161 [Lunasporangiospora selenospora]